MFSKRCLIKTLINILAIIAIVTAIAIYRQERKSTGTPQGSVNDVSSRNDSVCTPITNMVFLKVHKCASSTLTNIFQRFGEKHQLKFVLPKDDCYVGGYPEPFAILPEYRGHEYNMIVNHMVFNAPPIQELMPRDTVYIGVVRHPVSHLKSIYNFFRLWESGLPTLDQFEQNPILFYGSAKTDVAKMQVKNFQSFHYGLPASADPNDTEIEQFVKNIDRQFDFVIIAEHFKESLLLLKDYLCWRMEDILFVPHKLRHSDHENGEHNTDLEMVERNIRKWSSADYALFEHFNKTLWNKIAKINPNTFENQLNELNKQLKIKSEVCSKYALSTKINSVSSKNNTILALAKLYRDEAQTPQDGAESDFYQCARMFLNPINYVRYLKFLESNKT